MIRPALHILLLHTPHLTIPLFFFCKAELCLLDFDCTRAAPDNVRIYVMQIPLLQYSLNSIQFGCISTAKWTAVGGRWQHETETALRYRRQ